MPRNSCVFASLVFATIGLFAGSCAMAQDYPSRPIRLVAANSVGTIPDLIARVIGPEMSKFLGQPVIIENKPGANSLIAYEYVAKQVPADGYTFASAIAPDLASLPVTTKALRFDPLKDLPPLIGLVRGRNAFGSSSKLPWKSFNELVAHAKANPGKLNYGAGATIVRLLAEALIREKGLDVIYVPYSGGAPYLNALASGEVQMGFLGASSAAAFGDRFRVLAITGEQRLATFPDAPTFAELGLPQFRGNSYSLNVPAGIPKIAFDKLYLAASRALQQPEPKALFGKLGLEITNETSETAARTLADEAKFYADIAQKIGIQPQ